MSSVGNGVISTIKTETDKHSFMLCLLNKCNHLILVYIVITIVTGKMLLQTSGILNQQCWLLAVILQLTSVVG